MGIDRLRLLSGELESAFCTENGAHSWADIRATDPRFARAQVPHGITEAQQRLQQFAGTVLGRKSTSRLTFGASLRGDGTALADGTAPSADTLQSLLKLALGNTSAPGQGSTCAAGCTTTVINVAAGEGARFLAGHAIMINGEISVIESISTDALTLKHALSSAPSASDDVYNSYTAYIDPSASATWQFRALADDSALCWLLLGCVGGVTLGNLLQLDGTLPQVLFDLFVTGWETSGDSLSAGSYDGGDFLGTAESMEIIFEDHGTSTRTTVAASSLEVNPGVTWTQHVARGSSDSEHVERYKMTGAAPTASLTVDPASGYDTDWSSQTQRALLVTFGATAGRSWAIEVPRCKMSALPAEGAHAEQNAHSVTLRGYEDDCGAGTSALERASFRLHRV